MKRPTRFGGGAHSSSGSPFGVIKGVKVRCVHIDDGAAYLEIKTDRQDWCMPVALAVGDTIDLTINCTEADIEWLS